MATIKKYTVQVKSVETDSVLSEVKNVTYSFALQYLRNIASIDFVEQYYIILPFKK